MDGKYVRTHFKSLQRKPCFNCVLPVEYRFFQSPFADVVVQGLVLLHQFQDLDRRTIVVDDITLGRIKVREFERALQEECRCIVSRQVPVALIGIELDRKTSDIALGISRTASAGYH